jgi:Transposase DDE domain
VDVGPPFVATGQPPVAVEPRQRPLDHPSMAAQAGAGFDPFSLRFNPRCELESGKLVTTDSRWHDPRMDIPASFNPLQNFRSALYAAFGRRADALFEATDALLASAPMSALPHLSLAPLHRRGWGSVYAGLAQGRIDIDALRDVLAALPLGGEPVYAVDVSVWPRCDAETSPERGFYYHPSRHSAGKPIVAGWAYQWLAQLGFERDSWTAPLDVRRVHPTENVNAAAVEQIQALLSRLPPNADEPLFVFDAGYDPVQLSQGLAGTPAAILVRLRGGRCFYADPVPAPPSPKGGRPRTHGAKFACADPTTGPTPSADQTFADEQYGAVRVRTWAGLHPKQQAHAARGSRRPRPIVRGALVHVEVERLPRPTRPPRALWLWWRGSGVPEPARLWRAYVRRFDLEHTLRFCKQTLGWTTPRPRHPEQADRWTWLVLAAYTQLRLARPAVADRRLPWERPLPVGKGTPARVRRDFPQALVAVGSPASAPKPCGRSPGRPHGSKSGRAARHPAIKKPA